LRVNFIAGHRWIFFGAANLLHHRFKPAIRAARIALPGQGGHADIAPMSSAPLSLSRVWLAVAGLLATRIAFWLFWGWFAPGMAATLIALLLDALVLALATRQAWRIANTENHSGAALFTKALCLVLTVVSLNIFANQIARIATRPAPLAAAPALLPVTGQTATLTGPIDFESYNALQRTLAANPHLETLAVDSPGGLIQAARGLALLIERAGLNTHVTGTCASACTLAFLAGQTRTADPGAQIGFHGYRLVSDIATLDIDTEQVRDRAFLAARGIAPAFIARAYATPFDAMWFPTRAELLAAGILTR
jgi:hypothetical protein